MLVSVICLVAAGAVYSEKESGTIVDIARVSIEKWVETKRIISQEKRDWELGKEILNERIGLVDREIKSLEGKISDAEKSIAEADKKRIDLIDENEKLKKASASLDSVLVSLEDRTRQLLKRLPDPIRERVKPLSQRLPILDAKDEKETKSTMAERFQNIVGILNEIDKFNREITVTSEVQTLADGSSVEVTAMYIGIGQGYYTSAKGDIAGVGTATADGWKWLPADEAAGQISDAIAILKNEKVASFIQLPVNID